jgi:ABC-type glutathione transport system ATPase component
MSNNEDSKSHPDLVLDVNGLHISYETRKGDIEAVRQTSFQVKRGRTLGLVGESGCGNISKAMNSSVGLNPSSINSGAIELPWYIKIPCKPLIPPCELGNSSPKS